LSRLSAAKDDIPSFAAQLSWRTALPFAELRGIFPHADGMELERIYNFSSFNSTPVRLFLRLYMPIMANFTPF
jgi:hypothetical protein